MASEKVKDISKRAGWLFLVILFVGTSLGVGVAAFWQATHQPKDSTAQTTPPTPPPPTDNSCAIGSEPGVEALAKPEVYKTSGKVSELKVTDTKEGTGPAAKAKDCLIMKYQGSLASNGTVFDQNYDKPLGLKFILGVGQVIPGWDQGIAGMKVGGTRRLEIPAALGYGAQGSGSTIPPNSDLVFIVKLEKIK